MCLILRAAVASAVILHSLPAASDDLQYEAFWVDGEAASLHTAPLSRLAFLESGEDLATNGFVLLDVETERRNGLRLYAGLWTRGSGVTQFEGPIGPIQMRDAIDAREAQGLRLTDFEIFRTGSNGRRYVGVWRPGSGEQILTGPMQEDAFFARGETLSAQGLRLRDVEVEEVNGTLLYSGLFRSGAGLTALTRPMPLNAFRAALPGQLDGGLELIDLERLPDGQQVVGVFRSGDALAQITGPRSFAQHFILAQDQFNDDLRTRDFELFRVPEPENPDPVDPDNPPEQPENASHVEFTDTLRLRLEFTQIDDELFKLTLPRDALPPWLPKTEDGEPVLPDGHCGIHIHKADQIFWQIPGNPAVATPPFNAIENVAAELDPEFFNGGVHFAGSIGDCTGSQKKWVFPFPFTTTTSPPFEPLPNMSLVIQLSGDSEIQFIKDTGPDPKPMDARKLWKDSSREKLIKQVKFWEKVMKAGKSMDKYCPMIGTFWLKQCEDFPTEWEVCSAEVEELRAQGCVEH